jgi:hypothetical protein
MVSSADAVPMLHWCCGRPTGAYRWLLFSLMRAGDWLDAKSAIAGNVSPPDSRCHFDIWQFQVGLADQPIIG